MSDYILTRDLSSGKVHKRSFIGDKLASLEEDNLDDAGEYEVISEDQLSEVDESDLCGNCFVSTAQLIADAETGAPPASPEQAE